MSHLFLSVYLFLISHHVTLAYMLPRSASVTALVDKRFSYPSGIPQKVDTRTDGRGPQVGYNICNSKTEGPASDCQTAFVNHIDDFCLWAPRKPNSTIADTEGEEVAWCTKAGHGTRLIPPGALQGVQFTRTPGYVQVVGYIDQTMINMQSDDSGGELDSAGADGRGNPLGALVFTNSFSSGSNTNSTYTQAPRWHNFMGGNFFCIKACDPSGPNAASLCQHVFDRMGCQYNAPNAVQNNTFTSCEGDDQDPPGLYFENGQAIVYSQPPASLGPISSVPYQARIPESSKCVIYQSTDIYSVSATSTSTFSGSETTSYSTPSSTPSNAVTAQVTGLEIGPTGTAATRTIPNPQQTVNTSKATFNARLASPELFYILLCLGFVTLH